MITMRNLRAAEVDLARAGVYILSKAGVPGASDGAGIAEKGSLCVDTTSGKLYSNTGTKTTPAWTVTGAQT